MKIIFKILSGIGLTAAMSACSGSGEEKASEAKVVNVYSHRHYEADQMLYTMFTERTGIAVKVTDASADEVITKLQAEGSASQADLIITADVGRLLRAKSLGLLQSFTSEAAASAVPEHLRDPEGMWYPVTLRSRVIAYSKERVNPKDIATYEALADPKWKGKVLARPASNVYNQSLMAAMMIHLGEEVAEQWAASVVSNFAREPKGNDRDQIKDIAAGAGDLALVNTYYMGLLASSTDQAEKDAYAKVGLIFPNQNDRGAHLNISGLGLAKYAPNKQHAEMLLEFLLSLEAQEILAVDNHEYPVRADVKVSHSYIPMLDSMVVDNMPLSKMEGYHELALQALNRAGWK